MMKLTISLPIDSIWRRRLSSSLIIMGLLGFGCGPQKTPAPIPVIQTTPVAMSPPKEPAPRFDERVEGLLEALTIEEKVGQLNQRPGGHGISPNSLLTDAEKDLIRQGRVGSYLHVVGAEQNRSALCTQVLEKIQHKLLVYGIESGKRLVEH